MKKLISKSFFLYFIGLIFICTIFISCNSTKASTFEVPQDSSKPNVPYSVSFAEKLRECLKTGTVEDALELFNEDDTFDKIVLRHIVENDYMNCDTFIVVERDKKPQKRTIAASAKREVYEKYNFPRSMEFFKKFENALPLDARNENSSGIKKTDKYDKKMEIKYELKIMGHTDRLFATNKNFYFEHYSEIGFH